MIANRRILQTTTITIALVVAMVAYGSVVGIDVMDLVQRIYFAVGGVVIAALALD